MSCKTIEDSYCLKDAEHVKGTNRYVFTYNYQWRNIIHEHLTISIRSVKLWRRPRHLWLDNLYVHNNDENEDVPTSFDISITGSMTEFNNKMVGMIDSVGYKVYYEPIIKKIVFDCKDGYYFKYIAPAEANPQAQIPEIITDWSDDFKAITGATNIWNDMTVYAEDDDHNPTCFFFPNVWDRENVHIRASFVDLGYQNFLGVSNEQFIPPKEYPISYTDKKFSIELFDSIDRPIELPEDERGGLIIEAIMTSTI